MQRLRSAPWFRPRPPRDPRTSAHRRAMRVGSTAATVNAVMPPARSSGEPGAPPVHAGPAQCHDSGGSAQSSDTMAPVTSAGWRWVPEMSSRSTFHTTRMPNSARACGVSLDRRVGRSPCSRRRHRGAPGIGPRPVPAAIGSQYLDEAVAGRKDSILEPEFHDSRIPIRLAEPELGSDVVHDSREIRRHQHDLAQANGDRHRATP